MSQQYAGLERQGLDLQQRQLDINQDMIDFNKKMLVAQTIIQGTQAAVSLTSAAVGLGKAIQGLHDQKSNLAIQTGTTQYQAGVTEAITNGFNPYATEVGESGEQIRRYVGFDGYKMADGKTLGDLKQEIIDSVGKNYWTDSGSERGMQIATNAFENIELNAQRQLANEVMRNRQEVFNQELTNAIEVFRQTGDATQLNTVINSATWMSDDQRTATRLSAERQANLANINDTAMSIAQTQGMDAVNTYLTKQKEAGKINADQLNEYSLGAQKARSISLKPEQDRLNEEWNGRTANATTPEAAQRELGALQSRQPQFENADNMEAYYTYVQRLLSKGASLSGSGMSETQLNDYNAAMIKATMDRYESGQIGIDEAYAEMDSLDRTRWTIDEVEKRYIEMLGYKDPLTAKAYERAEQLCNEYKVDERIKNDFKQGLIRTFTNNEIDRKDRLKYVDDFMTKQTAEYLNKALKEGVSWSGSDQKKQNALSYEGKLDPFFTPVGKHGTQEMEVAGAGEIEKNVLNYSREIVKDALKRTDLEYVSHEFERNNENDKTGRVFHTVRDKDGNTTKVIVNPEGKLEYADDLSSFDGKIREGNESLVTSMREKLSDEQNRKIDELARAVNRANSRTQGAAMKKLRDELKEALGENYDKTDEGKAFEKYVLGRRM